MSSRPIRLQHAILPLIARPNDAAFVFAFLITEGYDPDAAVASWLFEIGPRYGSSIALLVTSVDLVAVDGQAVTVTVPLTTISTDDADLALSDIVAQGKANWSLTARGAEGEFLWRIQGPVDFVDSLDLPESGAATIGSPITIDLGGNEFLNLTILGNAEAGAAVTVDNAAVVAAIAEDPDAAKGALDLDSYTDEVEAAEVAASPGDTDRFGWIQTVLAVPTLRKVTGAGLKAWLKTYFDGIYAAAASYLTSITTSTPTNLTGLLKGNGTDVDVAVDGVDYLSSIADGSITLAKQANLAAATVIGRALGAGTGVPAALTAAQLRALQVIATTDDVTFNKVTVGDQLWAGAGTLRIAPAGINAGGYHPFTWYTGGAYAAIGVRLQPALDQIEINNGTTGQYRDLLLRDLIASRYLRPASYTVAAANALSSPPAGAQIHISNESGGACPAYYRGGWLRVADNVAIS